MTTRRDPKKWERVFDTVERLAVPGGWIYYREMVGMVFVPRAEEVADEWYEGKPPGPMPPRAPPPSPPTW